MHLEVEEHVDTLYETLEDISLQIHSNPELSWKEVNAHNLLTDFLEKEGFAVTRKACDIETAFVAEWRPEGLVESERTVTVGFLSEYDALPEIGHACGHNLIAIAGLGAALTLKHIVAKKALNAIVKLYGTPAEEDTGGKISMISKGAFEKCDIAIMVHPGKVNVTWAKYLALQSIKVDYHGKPAHAAAAPWDGVNALDALVSAYQSIGLLRQQNLPTSRVHGIIKNGGAAPNVIPEHTSGEFYIRAEKVEDLQVLRQRLQNIFDGAALSTGCRVEIIEDPVFADVRINNILAQRFEDHARRLGCGFADRKVQEAVSYGSTDMGNVTQVVPGIHPVFDIGCTNDIHTNEFREAAKTPSAIRATLRASKCMALTALDCILEPSLLSSIRQEFSVSVKKH
ncbi:hypothetical protein HDU97_001297 [Phlyctochytrium planicorne]|nr:hypothetical protein HDU97_001297 [Phlyctochytrium planicorne]